MSLEAYATQIEENSCYKTRCNICSSKIIKNFPAWFFEYKGLERICCENCKSIPKEISREVYGALLYDEPDKTQPLWRYMGLSKFVDVILFKRLWFSQIAKLNDSFEGAIGLKTRQESWRAAYFAVIKKALSSSHPPDQNLPDGQIEVLVEIFEKGLLDKKNRIYASCWHMSNHESNVMWQIYAANQLDSVCIKTNLSRIYNGCSPEIRTGIVKYINFDDNFADPYKPYLYKRAAFMEEKEARLFIECNETKPGHYVDIEPQKFIEEVVVSPKASSWIVDNLEKVIKLSGYNLPLRTSDLNQEPF